MFCERCGNQIEENSKFCPNCGFALGESRGTVVESTIAPSVNKKKVNICSIISIVFASIGIIPLLNILFVPAAIIFAILGFVTGKNKEKKTKIASIVVLTISILISLLWMLPAISSLFKGSSINDDSHINSCDHSYYIKQTEATCLSGGYTTYQCSLCNDTKMEYESALGHGWENNKCERCGILKDLELDPMDNNILSIEQIDWDINSANGVEPSITFTNRTNKQIAYVYFTIKFYDRMGNPAFCSISSDNTYSLKITGPINANEKDTRYWDPVIYNASTAAIKPLKIEIEFTDGTKQTIVCTGRYWYSGSYYGGDLHD